MADDIGVPTERLVKRTASGAITIWTVRVDLEPDGTAVIVTSSGLDGGKMKESCKRITEGKNKGRKNATTAQTQAVKDATSLWHNARDRELYGLTVEESDEKKAKAPMLAESWREKGVITQHALAVNWSDTDNLYAQPKFDGHRCVVRREGDKVLLFTKKGVPIVTCDHLETQLSHLLRDSLLSIDGELYIHGVAVTTIGGYIKKKQPGTEKLCLMIYDANMACRFIERLKTVERHMHQTSPHHSQLFLARTVNVRTSDELHQFETQCLEHGYEGAMLRHGTDGYAAGERSTQILKVKTFEDSEFEIVGCGHGTGSHENAAVFQCITADGHPFDCTAPGTLEKKAWYLEHSHEFIGKFMTIKYQKFTETEKPVPFQPVAKCFAHEKE